MSKQILFNRDNGNLREENDFYATPPEVTTLFLDSFLKNHNLERVLEPACGKGDISKVLEDYLFEVESSDLIDRGFGEVSNFLERTAPFNGSIITNPPFKYGKQFVKKALSLIPDGEYAIFLVRFQFLETVARKELFEKDIHSIWLHSKRIGCAINGDFSVKLPTGLTYSWVVFKKGYTKTPKMYWL